MIRLLKIGLMVFVSLFCLMYALQNIVNLDAAYGFVAYVVGMTGHENYPNHFGPAITSPILIWLMLIIIIGLEFTAAAVAGKGAWDLWRVRRGSADEFNSAKKTAILGCGIAVFIWFALFSAIGGAYFQMWQTQAGDGALTDAFQFTMLNGLILLIINLKDE